MIYTYFNDDEIKAFEKVSDNFVNDLFQEVRSLNEKYYLEEYIFVEKKLFKKIEKKVYTLYYKVSACEYQIVNFAPVLESSININVDKVAICSYLIGFLNGARFHKTMQI
jgi:hypothetical protein